MLFLSPLPILLAVGVKKLVDLSRGLAIPLGAGGITWAQPTLISAVICAASLPLFLFTTPLVRVISLVSGAVAILLVTLRHRANSSARIMIIIVLILILVNAAFRSLFPLLLASYNA
jgi:cytochrome bd-type quinol oxidase subunit 2